MELNFEPNVLIFQDMLEIYKKSIKSICVFHTIYPRSTPHKIQLLLKTHNQKL
jgi:hypothetical protein